MNKRIIDVPTGRRGADGILRLQQFTPTMIAMTISRLGERIPTSLLTKSQAIALRDALDELIPNLEVGSAEEQTYVEGVERRRRAA